MLAKQNGHHLASGCDPSGCDSHTSMHTSVLGEIFGSSQQKNSLHVFCLSHLRSRIKKSKDKALGNYNSAMLKRCSQNIRENALGYFIFKSFK